MASRLPKHALPFLLLVLLGSENTSPFSAAVLLRASSRKSKVTTSREPVTKETQESLETFFQLQYVGMQERELAMPRSPMAPKADLCVTAGAPDELDGVALVFTSCASKQIHAKELNGEAPKEDPAKTEERRQRQLFSFLIDGKIREKTTGFCIRRVVCSSNGQHVYDLGDCLDTSAAVWTIDRAEANLADKLKFMGDPVTAVTRDVCPVFCGPYRMRQHCKGLEVAAGGGCQTNFHSAPGWTKLPSQYVSQDTDPGKQVGMGFFREPFNDLAETSGFELESEKGGIAPLNQATGGICKSFISDGPDTESWFYFLRTKEKGQIYAEQK